MFPSLVACSRFSRLKVLFSRFVAKGSKPLVNPSFVCRVLFLPQSFLTSVAYRRIMPPKRKLASNALKGPEVNAGAPAVSTIQQRRSGESVDSQMNVKKTVDKYGTSSRVLRSQSTKFEVYEPPTCDGEELQEAHANDAHGKKAKEGATRANFGPPQNEVGIEHSNGDYGNHVARTLVKPGNELSAPIAAPGKAGKKQADEQENNATFDKCVNEEEVHENDIREPARVTKARGKTNKINAVVIAPEPSQPEDGDLDHNYDHEGLPPEESEGERPTKVTRIRGKGA